jgi:hypothetical protein
MFVDSVSSSADCWIMEHIDARALELDAERRHRWMNNVARMLAERGLHTAAADHEANRFLKMRDTYRRMRERLEAE